MDEYVRKLLEEENTDLNKLKEERLLKLKSAEKEEKFKKNKKTVAELRKEEERLNAQLAKLQKENFELQASINSYQVILTKKLAEFKEAETELNCLYTKVWKEREKFCENADEFDGQHGLLSDWWKTQVSMAEELEKRNECERNFENIQTNEIQGENPDDSNLIQENKKIETTSDMETESSEPVTSRNYITERETETCDFNSPESQESQITEYSCEENDESNTNHSSNVLFSMMDMNKMKLFKSTINRLAKNKFYA